MYDGNCILKSEFDPHLQTDMQSGASPYIKRTEHFALLLHYKSGVPLITTLYDSHSSQVF